MQYTHQKAVWTPFPDFKGKYPTANNSNNKSQQTQIINKDFLRSKLQQYIDFAKKNNVPIYCGEFGVDRYCYENNDGGENWTADMIDLFIENNIHFAYHDYHESWFGLFYNKKTEIVFY